MDKPHKRLKAWQRGMDIAVQIYKMTKKFPSDEKFGLISQMRRAAVSIPSNIAEGAARSSKKEFIQFLYIALGSLSELDTQIELAKRLDIISEDEWNRFNSILDKEDKILIGLIKSQKEKL